YHPLDAGISRGVERVVLTSSFAAVGYGQTPIAGRPFTEENWTELNEKVSAYVKSKTLAERAAWDFIDREGGSLELAVVNPVGIFGPVLGPDHSTSTDFIRRLMDGEMPGLPRMVFGVVDARDVADLHLRAMTNPAAKGERFLAISGDFMTMLEIARTLKARLGNAASRVTTRELPDWLVRIVGLFDGQAAQIVTELGKARNATSAKAMRLLGWTPRSREDALVATAESLVRLGLLKKSK
ncbi:MAG: NAD-dependent epimerase/dehydratase family protein, partial [Mesorhizobium sp.]